MKKSSIILLLFSLHLTVCFSQINSNNKTSIIINTDTIDINEQFLLVIKFPSKTIKTKSNYDEGYFVSYYIPTDTVMLSIYSNKLAQEPFITGTKCVVTDSTMIENVFFERSGSCLHSDERFTNKIGFFREKEYTMLSCTAKYEWADATKVDFYNSILNNIEILEKK